MVISAPATANPVLRNFVSREIKFRVFISLECGREGRSFRKAAL
jgi:hypothetical protein